MKNRLTYYRLCFGSLIFLCLLFSEEIHAGNLFGVRWIIDGDTIVLEDGRHVRYIGINSPEIDHKNHMAEPYGYEARNFNKKLVSTGPVRMEFDQERVDHYGRLLAYVFLPDETFINKELIKKGYACFLPRKPNRKHEKELLEAQRYAMKAKIGIWKNWKETNGRYPGNPESKRFHLDTCAFGMKIKKSNVIVFTKKWDAFRAGFAPCKKCFPGIHAELHGQMK